jgi:hypothetical protein
MAGNRQRKCAKQLGVSIMILGSRSAELLFEIWQCAVLAVHLLDFKFSKALKHRSVLHDGHLVERDVGDRGTVYVHMNAGPPDSQGRHRHEFPLSKMEQEQIAKQCRWKWPAIDQFNFLPIIHQREFQLPSLFPTLDSMAKGDPRMGQIVPGSIEVGRDQQASWNCCAREFGETKSVIDRQFDFTLDCG